MRKLTLYSIVCISLFFGILLPLSAQTKQGHSFTADEFAKMQSGQMLRATQATASNKTFNMDSIQYWVGEGTKQAALGVQWKNSGGTYDPVMVWGYRWENEADGTGERMIRAIAAHDSRFYLLLMGGTQYGTAIGGLGYDRTFNGILGVSKGGITLTPENGLMVASGSYNFDGWTAIDNDDYWYSGWMTGFWTYMVRTDYTKTFSSSGVGATSRKLTDGCWDLWVANTDFSWITDATILPNFTAATLPPDYTQGTFFVNEDWFGHNNSTINFLTDEGKWIYSVFQKENPGHELGCTSQFGTIYGGKIYIVSKQEKDPGATIIGSRLAVCDAITMKVKAEFTTIGEADGRSFLGVNESTGYIGTSDGIYIFNMDNLSIGNQIGGTGSASGGLYDGQIGTMLRVGDRVFAVLQSTGILVIDANTHTLETVIDGNYGSIVISKDGNIWASTDEGYSSAGETLVKINPYTLDTENIALSTETAIPNSWYAWTADGFCASKQNNKLYWKNNGGWFAATKIYEYDIDNDALREVIDLSTDGEGWGIYGAGFRLDPVTDVIYVSLFKEFWFPTYKVVKINPETGNIIESYPMEDNYWFPAMPVFPDNNAPVVSNELADKSISNETTIYLGDKVSDLDNHDAAIIKSIASISNNSLLTAVIQNNNLIITPTAGEYGDSDITIKFNSNGKIVTKTITVSISNATGLNDEALANTQIIVYPNPFAEYINIKTNIDSRAAIYNISGECILSTLVKKGENRIETSNLPKGTYILKYDEKTIKILK